MKISTAALVFTSAALFLSGCGQADRDQRAFLKAERERAELTYELRRAEESMARSVELAKIRAQLQEDMQCERCAACREKQS